jgi:hypothetical protein
LVSRIFLDSLLPNPELNPHPLDAGPGQKLVPAGLSARVANVEQESRDIHVAYVTRKIVAHPSANRDEAPASQRLRYPRAPLSQSLRLSPESLGPLGSPPVTTLAQPAPPSAPLGASLAASGLLGAHAHTTRIRSPSLDLKRILRVLAISGAEYVVARSTARGDRNTSRAPPRRRVRPLRRRPPGDREHHARRRHGRRSLV